MEGITSKIGVAVFLLAMVIVAAEGRRFTCRKYYSIMKKVKKEVERTDCHDSYLERIGFVTENNVFGVRACDQCYSSAAKYAKLHTAGAQYFKERYSMCEEDYESLALRCDDVGSYYDQCANRDDENSNQCENDVDSPTPQRIYRSIDGRYNNEKNHYWGAKGTPFAHFAPKNYEDGIYSIKKSVTGCDLPNARLLVEEVLSKAVRSPTPPLNYNMLAMLLILYATHDMHYQIPMQPKCVDKEIQCCTHDRSAVLPPDSLNSACLPIEVSKNDSVYKNENVGCLNMVRSEIAEYPKSVEAGEIADHVTAYLDVSIIYTSSDCELKQIRSYKNGTLRTGKNGLLPVDSNGKYLKSMDRITYTPLATLWPILFTLNHNHLAQRLAILNPHWNDEILFQEARRINCGCVQSFLITAKAIESVFNQTVNETYSELTNAATYLEFSFAYRPGHYYLQSTTQCRDENYTLTKDIPQSDAIGKYSLFEDDFKGMLRGAVDQPINNGPFSDEITCKIGKKTEGGYGTDLIAVDIQRGRDHGIASFLEVRRKCKLTPAINSFDDLHKIFNKTNVDLLKKHYKSCEDIDLYVGGTLELFEKVGNPLAGPTLGCIIGENYKNVMGGDIFYYTHPENPYPMTQDQIDAINKYSISNLICAVSGLDKTSKLWPYVSHPINPKIDCANFPPMNLTAWKE